jgi:hypothetical protein
MANLNSQNIGLNYKGILNLNTLNGNLSGTLQAVTDGDGNASPLQLSTTQVAVAGDSSGSIPAIFKMIPNTSVLTYGAFFTANYDNNQWLTIGKGSSGYLTFGDDKVYSEKSWGFGIASGTLSARLHVRGDGTNPIQRWQNGAGTDLAAFTNAGLLSFFGIGQGIDFYGQGVKFLDSIGTIDYSNVGGSASAYHRFRSPSSPTTGNQKVIGIESNFGAAAGNATFRPLSLEYTINNSGAQTGTATGIFLNATETALNGMGHNLMDLQVGGESRIKVDNAGRVFTGNSLIIQIGSSLSWSDRTVLNAPADGNLRITNSAGNNFGLLQFGGTTNAFPAIKRNSAGIDFRLADDSAFCGINAGEIGASVGFFAPNSTEVRGTYIRARASTFLNFSDGTQGILIDSASGTSASASAILQANSTTKGFLPPRMTTTQRDLIATPAAGLMIYNTTTNRPNFYDGSAWVAL